MNIEEFCTRFGGNARSIKQVMQQWQVDELDTLLRTLRNQHDQLVGAAVIAGDAMHGDGLRDQIPDGLRDAFDELMHEKADTYSEMRAILLKRIGGEENEFFSFDDRRVIGFISKLKGQIGENMFQREVGSRAHLADLQNQQWWDIWVDKGDGASEYVQVKMRMNPSDIVEEMLKVQRDVGNGVVTGLHGETVHQVKFAVPYDIADRVHYLSEQHDGLPSMLHETTIPISSSEAADIVKAGLGNVGPAELGHFFDELMGGAFAAGSLHALVNGFLWYRGAKEFSDAIASATASTAITGTGVFTGLVAESLLDIVLRSGAAVALSGSIGISSRILLGRLARSRWSFAEYLEKSITVTNVQIAALQP